MNKKRLDKFGHLGYILIFGGQFLLAEKLKWGWCARFLGELIWLFIGVKMKMSSIWLWGAVGLLFETYGFIRWMM